MADIFLIYFFGGGSLLAVFVYQWSIPMEVATFLLVSWNFGIGGLLSLYQNSSPQVHKFYLLALNVIMASVRAVSRLQVKLHIVAV